MTTGPRVFVTGASGFVGRALLPALAAAGSPVVALTRDRTRLGALAAHVDVVIGGLMDAAAIALALRACDVVVHCAKSDSRDHRAGETADVSLTRTLIDAAVQAGVRRFVHLSTTSVYPVVADGVIDESWPYAETGDVYARTKIRVETDVVARRTDIDVVVLQPANIYGPGGWWGAGLPSLMRRGRVILVDDGRGTANLVHRDDVARAIVLALSAPVASGSRFLVTDGAPRPWRDYYVGLERLLGRTATVAMPADAASRYSASNARGRACAARGDLGHPATHPPPSPLPDRPRRHCAAREPRGLLHRAGPRRARLCAPGRPRGRTGQP